VLLVIFNLSPTEYLEAAPEGTVMVVAEAYVHESDTDTHPSKAEALVVMLILASASLLPAMAAALLMLSLSKLPLISVTIVLTCEFTSAASAVVPSVMLVTEITPMLVSSCLLLH
jgi:hypothetical protein